MLYIAYYLGRLSWQTLFTKWHNSYWQSFHSLGTKAEISVHKSIKLQEKESLFNL